MAVFLLVLRLGGGKIELSIRSQKVIDVVSKYSFGIYLSHILYLDTIKIFLDKIYVPAYIGIPGVMCVVGMVALITVWFMNRIKIDKILI